MGYFAICVDLLYMFMCMLKKITYIFYHICRYTTLWYGPPAAAAAALPSGGMRDVVCSTTRWPSDDGTAKQQKDIGVWWWKMQSRM